MTTGVIIGRFQTPELHEGHRNLLKHVARLCDYVIILVGIPMEGPDKRNPLDFYTRKLMIEKFMPHAMVLPLRDTGYDFSWSVKIDRMIKAVVPPSEKVELYGGRDNCLAHYSGEYDTVTVHIPTSDPNLSATKIRAAVRVRNNPDFRAGVIYAQNCREE